MARILVCFIVGIMVSFYLFPIGFMFLPSNVNTKMFLSILGAGLFGYECIRSRMVSMQVGVLGAMGLALLFSMICYISIDLNGTSDYSYVGYIGSFFTWLSGAYAVCYLIRMVHGVDTFRLLVLYLAAVCFSQCVLALLIDNHEGFKILVDSYVRQGQEFFDEVDRLYGIGAALDSAGVRFAIVIVMILSLICHDSTVRRGRATVILLFIALFTIAVVGNAISRTTIIGLAIGVLYFIGFSGLFKIEIKRSALKLGGWFVLILGLGVLISTYLYHTNMEFYRHMRFAFEGFFNLVEKGEWKTSSTDKLNNEMWIWPSDVKTWIIGSGLFGNFIYGTDIGYCRFILYSGLSGFSVFALFFIYNGCFFIGKIPQYAAMFVVFILMGFLFWIKVATDIFFIYALFFCLGSFIPPRVKKTEK